MKDLLIHLCLRMPLRFDGGGGGGGDGGVCVNW